MTDCIEYSATQAGYVRVRRGGIIYSINRLVCGFTFGLVYDDKNWVTRHKCGNKKCIRVEHLIPARHVDCIRDAMSYRKHAAGERHGMVKLTDADVVAIRADTRSNLLTATAFGVSRAHVARIRSGKIR